MLVRFKGYISKEHLFTKKDNILLAVSGGMDSVAMCELFHLAGYPFAMAHCNFGLRGKESEGDEQFVKELAKKYKVPFFTKRFATEQYAKKQGVSIQMAARELRYAWFEELLKKHKYHYIATAHHLDDQIESFFIHLLRGSGITGLRGILPKNQKIVHPLLFCYRKDIAEFVHKEKLAFREDSSNKTVKYQRNKLRHQIIPLFAEVNSHFKEIINENISRIRASEAIYRQYIDQKRKEIVLAKGTQTFIEIEALKKLHPLPIFLFEFLLPFGFNYAICSSVAESLNETSGKKFFSPSHCLVKDRKHLIVSAIKKEKNKKCFVNEDMAYVSQPCILSFLKRMVTEGVTIPIEKNIASVDYDKLKYPLQIRRWERGDVFYPFGMNAKKKLSDFFIDNKLSLLEKENTYVLTSDGKIVWVIGHRIDNRYRITQSTKNILQIRLHDEKL